MPRIAIFASGTGTNAARIMEHFESVQDDDVALVVSSRADAGVLEIAERHAVSTLVLNKAEFRDSTKLLDDLRHKRIDFIVLAGFLWLIPPYLIRAYPERIVNIHPALLPKYGGKGMYGMNVHRAVIENQEAESGITIHLVNEVYDSGRIIFQAACPIESDDTPETLAKKVQKLEHRHFPPVVENLLKN